jgi:hypothetical protein
VDNEFLFDSQVSIGDIPGKVEGFELCESALLLDVLLEVSSIAKLSHDIDVVLRHEYFDCPEDMRVGKRPQGVDLVIEEILLDL